MNTISKFWQRVPIIIRAILSGFFVYAIVGSVVWFAVLGFIPVPWSLPVMVVVLWLYLKYYSGSWGAETSRQNRVENFRSKRLAAGVWRWSMLAAIIAMVVFQAAFVVTFRVIQFPAESWDAGFDFSGFPVWMVWAYIVLTSSVAGITEEVGFRGYMQVPLEKRYGPAAAIIVSALIFMLLHLNQAWAPVVLVPLFVIGAMWGILAYASGSLIPGIISHAALDVINFSYWWTDVAGTFDKQPISATGIDGHFIGWSLVLVVSVFAFVFTTRKILAERKV